MIGFKKREKIDEVLKEVYDKSRLVRYSNLILGCFLMAISFYLFFLPLNIVHGGVSGISIVTEILFGIDPSILIFVCNIILLLLSYFLLGWDKTKVWSHFRIYESEALEGH